MWKQEVLYQKKKKKKSSEPSLSLSPLSCYYTDCRSAVTPPVSLSPFSNSTGTYTFWSCWSVLIVNKREENYERVGFVVYDYVFDIAFHKNGFGVICLNMAFSEMGSSRLIHRGINLGFLFCFVLFIWCYWYSKTFFFGNGFF